MRGPFSLGLALAVFIMACGNPSPQRTPAQATPTTTVTPAATASPASTETPAANEKKISINDIKFTNGDGVQMMLDEEVKYDPATANESLSCSFGDLTPTQLYCQAIISGGKSLGINYYKFASSAEAKSAAQHNNAQHTSEKDYRLFFACHDVVVQIGGTVDLKLAQDAADKIAQKAGIEPVRLVDQSK